MAYVARAYGWLQGPLSGLPRGSMSVPTFIALAGETLQKRLELSALETAVLFDASADALATWDLAWIQADHDVTLEFVVDQGGEVGTVVFTLVLKGSGVTGQLGLPLMLGSQVSVANPTVDFGGGTNDLIEKISVKNASATAVAHVEAVFAE